ncbi:MAG: hypothetical protein JNL38_22940 [Myxococcales bacterium]|nr:hypothetical protein [Myxococcales bacterium]
MREVAGRERMQALDHERLDVYHLALDFLVFANSVIEGLPRGRSHDPMEHTADPMESTRSEHSNFRSDPIGHGHGHGHGHGETEPVQGHALEGAVRRCPRG